MLRFHNQHRQDWSRQVGSSSVFLLSGEPHRRERSLLSPAFHGKSNHHRAEIIRAVALRTAHQWQPNETIRIADVALDVSLEVIIRIVFGVQTQQRVESFKQKIKDFVTSFHPALAFSRLLHRPLFGLSPWNRFVKARGELLAMLDDEIAARQVDDSSDNILSQLLQSRYEDGADVNFVSIRDQLVTLLLAGHETTQIAIAWGMSWLHRTPQIADQLRAELDANDSTDAIQRAQLLDGVCNESLRINPILADVVRNLTEPMEWQEMTLPAGSNVAIPICLTHEDEQVFPDPFRFDPHRWKELEVKPHQFMPFGGGVRRCIGAPLAIMEMKDGVVDLDQALSIRFARRCSRT